MTNHTITKNSMISIGLAITLLGAIIHNENRYTEIRKDLDHHVEHQSYHHNIHERLDRIDNQVVKKRNPHKQTRSHKLQT